MFDTLEPEQVLKYKQVGILKASSINLYFLDFFEIVSIFAIEQKKIGKKYLVVLTTALINLNNKVGNQITLPTMFDPGSQISFITQKAAKKIGTSKM